MNVILSSANFGGEPEGARPWLDAAYQVLITQGVDKIRIATLAEMVVSTRTAFYWHFTSREALLDGLLDRWKAKNIGNFVRQVDGYAETINEAVFNMFDCWLVDALFDAPFDLAVRHWAKNDPALTATLARADAQRIEALIRMFRRFGYDGKSALVRAHTAYFSQIGYISMMIVDDPAVRIDRMPDYVEVYTGVPPSPAEIARFRGRHIHTPRG